MVRTKRSRSKTLSNEEVLKAKWKSTTGVPQYALAGFSSDQSCITETCTNMAQQSVPGKRYVCCSLRVTSSRLVEGRESRVTLFEVGFGKGSNNDSVGGITKTRRKFVASSSAFLIPSYVMERKARGGGLGRAVVQEGLADSRREVFEETA